MTPQGYVRNAEPLAKALPRRHLHSRPAPGTIEIAHRLKCWHEVGVGGNDNSHVVVLPCRVENQVDCELDIDALLLC